MNQVFGKVCRASVAAAGVMVAASAASAESRPLLFETEFDVDLAAGIAAVAPRVGTLSFDVPSAAAKWEESIGAYLEGLVDVEAAPAADAAPAVDAAAADLVARIEIQAFTVTEAPAAEAGAKPLPPEVLVALGFDLADAVLEARAAVPAAAQKQGEGDAAKPQAAADARLLAPVLSEPMGCPGCAAHAAHAARVDDAAAWQKLADWAASRVAEGAAATAAATAAVVAPVTEARINDDAAWEKLAEWAAARGAEDTAAEPADREALTAEGDFFFEVDDDTATE